jgi:uncharacterized membrane protein YgdD (TMEM256/DUF423 family)
VTRGWVLLGALSAAAAVAAGAFGAHGLKASVAPEMLAAWDTAARYQLAHAVALVALAGLARTWSGPTLRLAGALFVAGTVFFCGSLYLLVFTGVRGFGAVTPLGGLAFVAGWLVLAWGALRAR